VAKLVSDVQTDPRPWLALRGERVRWKGNPFAPVVADDDIEALK
jgi:hypothetical protein